MFKGCMDYQLTRRSMLQATVGTFLGMSVNKLIAAEGTSHAATCDHVILFWNGGGMSHIDTFDPKPGRPTQGDFNPIKTSASGVEISEIFPELAKQMKNIALVRSIAGTNGDHGRATYQLQTSYNPQSGSLQHPGLGSVVVHEKKNLGDLPAYITISGQAARAGYLGQKCEAYFVARPGEKDPYLAFPAGIAETRGNQRLDVLARFNQRQAQKIGGQAQSTETAIDEAVKLMRSPALEAFELSKEKPETLERYGNNEFGRGALLARRLVEKGVRFVQINRGGFDTHINNFPAMEAHGEVMDPALAALIGDLAQTGMLKKTMVIMLSEFGRTPKINMQAGRDHHASVFTGLFAGGGIKGGQVIGSSDQDGVMPKDRPVKVSHLHASVCHALGIDFNKEVMTPLERPMKLVDKGAPVNELFA